MYADFVRFEIQCKRTNAMDGILLDFLYIKFKACRNKEQFQCSAYSRVAIAYMWVPYLVAGALLFASREVCNSGVSKAVNIIQRTWLYGKIPPKFFSRMASQQPCTYAAWWGVIHWNLYCTVVCGVGEHALK